MEINCRSLCDRSFFFFQSSFFWREVDLTNKRLVRSHEGSGGGGPTAARYFFAEHLGTLLAFAYLLDYYPLYLLKVLRYLDAYIVKFADGDLIRK